MPFSTFSWYTGNVFTFCSGTGNDARLLYQYIITIAYLTENYFNTVKTFITDQYLKYIMLNMSKILN
jgi:hypothetical protein